MLDGVTGLRAHNTMCATYMLTTLCALHICNTNTNSLISLQTQPITVRITEVVDLMSNEAAVFVALLTCLVSPVQSTSVQQLITP